MLLTILAAGADAAAPIDASNVVSLLSGLTALAAIAITSLRKRKDVSVEEMQARIVKLEGTVEAKDKALEAKDEDLEVARQTTVVAQRDLFIVRQTLASNGIPDPTTRTGTV